jgi:hypothetical protein
MKRGGWLREGWVAKLVARLLVESGFESRHPSKNMNGHWAIWPLPRTFERFLWRALLKFVST